MDLEPDEEVVPGRAGRGCALVLGVNLVLGLMVLATFWAIGNSLDQTRSGVVDDGGTLFAVSAVCPGERLEAVRLFRIGTGEEEREELLWEIEGDGNFPERFEIGEPLPGLNTIVALTDRLGDSDELVFRLRSNQLQTVDAFQFVPARSGELRRSQSSPSRRSQSSKSEPSKQHPAASRPWVG